MSLTGKEVAQMHKDYVMQSWARSGADTLPVERAEGIYFYDYDGKKYADMASLLVCSNLGHELPEIVEAIKEQADKMCFMAPAYASEPKSMLAKMLVEAAGADTYKRVFFCYDLSPCSFPSFLYYLHYTTFFLSVKAGRESPVIFSSGKYTCVSGSKIH